MALILKTKKAKHSRENASSYGTAMRTRAFAHTQKPDIQVWQQAVYKPSQDCWSVYEITRRSPDTANPMRDIESLQITAKLSKREALEHLHEYDRSQPGMGFEPARLPLDPGMMDYRELAHYDGYGFDSAGHAVEQENAHITGTGTFEEAEILAFAEDNSKKPLAPVFPAKPGSRISAIFSEIAAQKGETEEGLERRAQFQAGRYLKDGLKPLVQALDRMNTTINVLTNFNNHYHPAQEYALLNSRKETFWTTWEGRHGAGSIESTTKDIRKELNKDDVFSQLTMQRIEEVLTGYEIYASVLHARALFVANHLGPLRRGKAIERELKVLEKKVLGNGGTMQDFEALREVATTSCSSTPSMPESLAEAAAQIRKEKEYFENKALAVPTPKPRRLPRPEGGLCD